MTEFTYIESHGAGTEEVWLSLSLKNACITGFFDVESIQKLHAALGASLNEVAANKEKLEEFNSERFHPTGREPAKHWSEK